MTENTTLRKLVLLESDCVNIHDEPYSMVPVLHSVASNTTIEDLEVQGELIEGHFNLP